MGLSFAQPAALWALLGIPFLLAVHFLQSRHRRVSVSTLFLLERISEEDRQGAVFQRLRQSPQLWLQLAVVLLTSLLLARPMRLNQDAVQSVAVVLDSSCSMQAFLPGLRIILEEELGKVDRVAATTEWWILSDDPALPRLYHGEDLREALSTLDSWQPRGGAQKPGPALRLARQLTGADGLVLFVTDHPEGVESEDAQVLGVGRAMVNSALSGIQFSSDTADILRGRVSMLHFGTESMQRRLRLQVDGQPQGEWLLTLEPEGVATVETELPTDFERGEWFLEEDAAAFDNRLPFVRPRRKPLTYALKLQGPAASWAAQIMSALDETRTAAEPLLIWRQNPLLGAPAAKAEIRLSGENSIGELSPVTAGDHPLARQIPWEGWLARPLAREPVEEGEQVLAWMGELPLVSLRESETGSVLSFHFDPEEGNAARHPAPLLLVHRYVEMLRADLPGFSAVNLEIREPILLPKRLRSASLRFEFTALEDGKPVEVDPGAPPRAPETPGYLRVWNGEELLLEAGVSHGEIAEGDLRLAAPQSLPDELLRSRRLRHSRSDFLRGPLFALLGLCLIASWQADRGRREPT